MDVTVGSGAGTVADGAGIVAVGVGVCVGVATEVGGRSGTRITNGVLVGYGVAVGRKVAVGATDGSAACVGMAVGAGAGVLVVHAAMMAAARVAVTARVGMVCMRLGMSVLAGAWAVHEPPLRGVGVGSVVFSCTSVAVALPGRGIQHRRRVEAGCSL